MGEREQKRITSLIIQASYEACFNRYYSYQEGNQTYNRTVNSYPQGEGKILLDALKFNNSESSLKGKGGGNKKKEENVEPIFTKNISITKIK